MGSDQPGDIVGRHVGGTLNTDIAGSLSDQERPLDPATVHNVDISLGRYTVAIFRFDAHFLPEFRVY